jgi:hypothetical protein
MYQVKACPVYYFQFPDLIFSCFVERDTPYRAVSLYNIGRGIGRDGESPNELVAFDFPVADDFAVGRVILGAGVGQSAAGFGRKDEMLKAGMLRVRADTRDDPVHPVADRQRWLNEFIDPAHRAQRQRSQMVVAPG